MNLPSDILQDSTGGTRDHNARLHAELRDVPLPVGFMHRMRKLVYEGLEQRE